MRTTRLRGAKTNNLKGLNLDLEPGTFIAVAGPSGAGKSSLAFGTLYAEGQRRYVESFSAYARQFLERMARPPVDELDPVPVAIAVDRKDPVRTSRSTVGTMTEVLDYLKVLWARKAELHCRECGAIVRRDAPESAARAVADELRGERVVVTYPVAAEDAEHFLGVREALIEDGYRRVMVDGRATDLDGVPPSLAIREDGTIDVVADRAVAGEEATSRLVEALEAAMERGEGRADVYKERDKALSFSSALRCDACGISYPDKTPGLFSFNSPVGACPTCRGFGRVIGIDLEKVLPDPDKSLAKGAVRPWTGKSTAWERRQLRKHAERAGVPMDVPLRDLDEEQVRWLIEGDELGYPKGWWGILAWFDWLEGRAYKMHVRVLLSRYRKYDSCPDCRGTRLRSEALGFRIEGLSMPEMLALPVQKALSFVREQAAEDDVDAATRLLLDETERRLSTLVDVGLGYLSLDRPSRSLSGGETQRVALTGALGAALNGALFVLDEPTVGLHPRDVGRLVEVIRGLSSGENVALVVEHHAEVLKAVDRVIELGPGAGERGGEIVFDGTPAELRKAATATGKALRSRRKERPRAREPRGILRIVGARGHNLRGVSLELPIGTLTCVTGVSGSGKSSLILETLEPAVSRALGASKSAGPLPFESLEGASALRGVVAVDQSALGRTSRGNPATYLKIWDAIRKRLTQHPLSKERGYKPGFFSFNVPGGRCEACKGEGAETVEMQFLSDVTFSCPECGGGRFVGPVLDVRIGGLNAAQLLDLTAHEAEALFAEDEVVLGTLAPLTEVGLGYLRLGQPSSTLSGGEAQRLKLASALSQAMPGSLVVLDEPTAGLHPDDVTPLLRALDRLVDRGDTVVVVEHNMRVAAHADHVVELGPGAGDEGGRIVAEGSPEQIARDAEAPSAPYLLEALGEARSGRKRGRKREKGKRSEVPSCIVVERAREHNLRDLSVRIPRDALVVVTGPSGSGKSSLAFDVVFAEAQRRYLETLSPYARQYMPQLPRAAVDRVAGVPPTVSLEQRLTRGGTTSTVATVTEVAHYLRVLWAKAGVLHCPECSIPIEPRPASAIARDLAESHASKQELLFLAPVIRGRKGSHREVFAKAVKEGLTEARVDGELRTISGDTRLERYREHDIELLVARSRAGSAKLQEAVEEAIERGKGGAFVLAGKRERYVSTERSCGRCGRGFPELDPRFFSFNTRQGQCPVCEGRGWIVPKKRRRRRRRREEGPPRPCTACDQTRMSKLARSVTVRGLSLDRLFALSVTTAAETLDALELRGRDAKIGVLPLAEATRRLRFLEELGLGYLGLDRAASTLSGGELQRVRLSAQLGAGMTGVLYVLDEPTIGLHPRDTGRLIRALRKLVDKGNSVIVVEHDTDVIRASDHVVDIGPGGGHHGGRVVADGEPDEVAKNPRSATGRALAGRLELAKERRSVDDADLLVLEGARLHNLRDVRVEVPLGRLTAVTGVSGSGKSTLVREVLLPLTRGALGLVADSHPQGRIRGAEALRRAVEVDQSPIGRTPRSVPATYIGIWDEVRKLLAGTPLARSRGYGPGRFSFNTEAGRCAACKGQGAILAEMSFLPDVHVPCEACGGTRFGKETRHVRYRGKHVGEILELEAEEAAELFSAVPKIARPLGLMCDLGLGYLKLGQASNTLSGGEAQRVKLVSELSVGSGGGPTLYVLDEPTTGLHREDVHRLIEVLHRFVDRGDTVVVIEHQTDLVAAADWVIDLGPEGGEGGGEVVVEATPEGVAAHPESHTGAVLARERGLRRSPAPRARPDPVRPSGGRRGLLPPRER